MDFTLSVDRWLQEEAEQFLADFVGAIQGTAFCGLNKVLIKKLTVTQMVKHSPALASVLCSQELVTGS